MRKMQEKPVNKSTLCSGFKLRENDCLLPFSSLKSSTYYVEVPPS